MFNNRFNSTKKDPLVEAVQSAMQDGELRRQAEAYVNEAFGVYNRNAVVREDLAAYDAAIEEAYKCMKEGEKKDEKKEDKPKADYSKMREKMVGKGKDLETTRKIVGEAKKLADKDYDKDGKVESPKDEVWGSRFRAAKMAGKMEEEQIDELKAPTAKTAHDAYRRAERSDDEKGNWDRSNRLYRNLKKKYPGKSDRNQKPTGKAKLPQVSNTEFHKDGYSGHVTKKGKLTKSATKDTKADIKSRLGRHTKPNLPEEVDYSAPDRAAVTRDNKPSTPAQTNAATSGPSAADKAALTSKIKTMKEAAYSAKAARAGKDIGKPGKSFSKIAKSAGEKYGSEERGKKVAGAILKRIRAKHMKEENLEELSAFGKAFAAAKGQNFTFGGKQYSGAMKGQTGSSSSSSGPQSNAGLRGATGFPSRNISTSKAEPNPRLGSSSSSGPQDNPGLRGSSMPQTPKAPTPADRWNASRSSTSTSAPAPTGGPARDVGMTGKAGGEKGVTSGSTVSLDRPGNVGASTPSSPPEQSRAAPGTFAARSAAGEMKADAASAGVKKLMSMNESVQVGANRYRIV